MGALEIVINAALATAGVLLVLPVVTIVAFSVGSLFGWLSKWWRRG